MKYLLDTCILSELIKKAPDPRVTSWVMSQRETELHVSVLTFGELQKGISKLRDSSHKVVLRKWVDADLRARFRGRILPIDLAVACRWGIVQGLAEMAGKPMPAIDGLIVASALEFDCAVVTRNTSDMEASKVRLINPWQDVYVQ